MSDKHIDLYEVIKDYEKTYGKSPITEEIDREIIERIRKGKNKQNEKSKNNRRWFDDFKRSRRTNL